MEEIITKLFRDLGLGEVTGQITPVSGGLMHRMFKVTSGGHDYAVKALNPEILARPDARANYARAESLEQILEEAGIPIVPAKGFGGKKMQECGGRFFYVFDWLDGSITDWEHTSVEQCYKAGNVLGRMHSIDPREAGNCEKDTSERDAFSNETGDFPEVEESHIEWEKLIAEAREKNSEIARIEKTGAEKESEADNHETAEYGIAELLLEKKDLLEHAERELNAARKKLPPIECISDEDMDPKNIMWKDGEPYVIDLECLDRGNPVSHVLQLALQWSGITIRKLDIAHVKSFFDGYFAAYDNGFRKYDEVFGLAYTWLEWLEYNISRALGRCADEDEQRMGIEEVRKTIERIGYIALMEKEIKELLAAI